MEIPKEIIDQVSEAEDCIRQAQDHIDRCRAANPTDQQFQLSMDLAQSALDLRKKRVRDLKMTISVLSE